MKELKEKFVVVVETLNNGKVIDKKVLAEASTRFEAVKAFADLTYRQFQKELEMRLVVYAVFGEEKRAIATLWITSRFYVEHGSDMRYFDTLGGAYYFAKELSKSLAQKTGSKVVINGSPDSYKDSVWVYKMNRSPDQVCDLDEAVFCII